MAIQISLAGPTVSPSGALAQWQRLVLKQLNWTLHRYTLRLTLKPPSPTSRPLSASPFLMRILLANPRGFCAGVDRAIDIVERAVELFGAPIHVRHEVVHNRFVVDRLKGLGAVFVDELDEVPDGATVIFSAHGVSKAVQAEARRRGLQVFDATCPLVTKVHMEVTRYGREGRDVILIGHEGHPEVEGTMGQFDDSHGARISLVEDVADVEHLDVRDPARVGVVTQTTLSVDDTADVLDALKRRFPTLATPRQEDICYATQNRQDAVKKLVAACDVVVVVGSQTSSNSNRLREIAEKAGIPGYLVDGPEDLRQEWFEGKCAVGVTAGASAPELLVQRVVGRLKEWGGEGAEEIVGREENVVFSLPRELRQVERPRS
jgi:4-hydroxy-3-methylbut-2-enyl diphosphate reductase